MQNKLYFRDKLISQLCQIRPGYFLAAEYSKTGYWLLDRNEAEAAPSKIEDTRTDHNAGCTDLQLMPLYDPKMFPYAISRTKFKVDLIDLEERRVLTLCSETNSSGMTRKMVV